MIYIAGIVCYVTFTLGIALLYPNDYWEGVKITAIVTAIIVGFAWSFAYLVTHL